MLVRRTKKNCKDLNIKNLGEYHNQNVHSIFENIRNKCLKRYDLDPAKCLLVPGLAWQAALKKTKIKLNIFTDIDVLLMVGKGIRVAICHSIY